MKKCHTQLGCRSRIRQNKPLTWKSKEVKTKLHSREIMIKRTLETWKKLKNGKKKYKLKLKNGKTH
jgi:hypothetical protein